MQAAKITPRRTILFAADVGEEGEGNLRGMRALVDEYRGEFEGGDCAGWVGNGSRVDKSAGVAATGSYGDGAGRA